MKIYVANTYMHNVDVKTLEGEEKPVSLPVTGSVYARTHIYRYVNNTCENQTLHMCSYVCTYVLHTGCMH